MDLTMVIAFIVSVYTRLIFMLGGITLIGSVSLLDFLVSLTIAGFMIEFIKWFMMGFTGEARSNTVKQHNNIQEMKRKNKRSGKIGF